MLQKTREMIEDLILNLVGLPTTQDPDVKRLFEEGVKLYAECKFKEAITAFEHCLLLPSATIENKTALNLLKSIEILKRIGDKYHLAASLSNIAILYLDIGKKEVAKQYLQQSYELYLEVELKSDAEEVKRRFDSI